MEFLARSTLTLSGSGTHKLARWAIAMAALAIGPTYARAQTSADACPRPSPGSAVPEPADIHSQSGLLKITFSFRRSAQPDGSVRYCYIAQDGSESPTLRVQPGDEVIFTLKNEIPADNAAAQEPAHLHTIPGACAGGGAMSASATNLHFHGLAIPALCHQDEVLTTSVLPASPPYEYRFKIPADQPPGLYWYHPHLHGFTKAQVLGGASGALIVEGLERFEPALAGIPERVLVIRDQDLLHPNAAPNPGAAAAPVVIDKDGDALNTGDGTGMPAKDISVNFVPVPYPNYEPAILRMKPKERQLWRVLNASAITYVNLQIVFNGAIQWMAVVGLDGVPLGYSGQAGHKVSWQTHVGIPPGGRAEFVFAAPSQGAATFETKSVDTGTGGENDPIRPIANIVISPDAPEPQAKLAISPQPMPRPSLPWLGDVAPARTRKLYFSETLQDPDDPNSPTTFFITVDGQTPTVFDPQNMLPNITVHQGDVEDWIIENRSRELHAFHIHQLHFLLLERFGAPAREPFLRDTLNIPFWDGKTSEYPSVKVRMDFRGPDIVGVFPYHCHLLEHEDGGMMGVLRVEPAERASANSSDPRSGASPSQ